MNRRLVMVEEHLKDIGNIVFGTENNPDSADVATIVIDMNMISRILQSDTGIKLTKVKYELGDPLVLIQFRSK